jgi:hypothetical protein
MLSEKQKGKCKLLKNNLVSFFEDLSEITVYNILKNLLSVEEICLPAKETLLQPFQKILLEYFESSYNKEATLAALATLEASLEKEESIDYNKEIKELYFPHKYIPMQFFMISKSEFWKNFYGKLYLAENKDSIKGHPHHSVSPKYFAKCLYNIERGDLIIAKDCPKKDKYICLFMNFICNKMKKESVEAIFQLLEDDEQIYKQKIVEFMNSKNKNIFEYLKKRDVEDRKNKEF